jgi:hypothetical protein
MEMRHTYHFAVSLFVMLVWGVLCDGVRAAIVAEQPTEFSGTQGTDRWYYGFYDRTADLEAGGNGIFDDTKFVRFKGGESSTRPLGPDNQWYFTYWVYGPDAFPSSEINAESMYPSWSGGTEQFAVLRWVSDTSGVVKLTGYFDQVNGRGDGTIGRIFRNGEEIFAEHTLEEPAEIDLQINNMATGDTFDFAVDFGTDYDGNDQNDETRYWFTFDRIGDIIVADGDFDGNGVLDAADLDDLTAQVAASSTDMKYDVNSNSAVEPEDITFWVKDLFNGWIGDANLDGEFNSGDLVSVLASGTYEADVDSVWSTGDFTGDGRTNSGDLVAALADGGYEAGPQAAVSAVPEPSSWLLCLLGCLPLLKRVRRR